MVSQARIQPRPLHERVVRRLSNGTRVDGMWVGSRETDAAVVSRVLGALALIQTHDRRRYALITRDLEKIWIAPLIGRAGEFDAAAMTCRIDTTYAMHLSTESLASAIVHEATHARMANLKIAYSDDLRCRVEGACMRQELAFAKRLPDNRLVIESIEARLQAARPDTCSDEAMAPRFEGSAHQKARDQGLPGWLTSILMRIGKIVVATRRWSTAK